MLIRPIQLLCLLVVVAGVAAPRGRAQPFTPSGFPHPAHEAMSPRVVGNPLLHIWRAEDYEAGPVNSGIVQHPGTGLIYAGNTDGVLEFDGFRWRLLPLPRAGAVVDLAVDAAGRIWMAGETEIARLEPDELGQLGAVAVEGILPADDNAPQRVLATPGGVWFGAARHIGLVRPDGGSETWQVPERFGSIWWMDGALHTVVADRDVVRLEDGGRLTVIFTREQLRVAPVRANLFEVFAARPDGPGEWLLLTALGPVRWNAAARTWRPLPIQPPLFREWEAIAATFLAGGGMAFTGPRGGVVVINAAGRIERLIDRMPPVVGPRIRHLAEDREGGLWISARDRIVRMQLQSPLARHEAPQGVLGSPRQMLRHEGVLYLAHGEGISHYIEWPGGFRPLEGVRQGAEAMAVVDGRLMAAAGGLLEWDGEIRFRRWSEEPLNALSGLASAPGMLLAGDTRGLVLWRRQGAEWQRVGRLEGLGVGVASVFDAGDGCAWGATRDGRVWRADFRMDCTPDAPVTLYGAAQGVPAVPGGSRIEIMKLGEFLTITAPGWLLRFDPAAGRFVPEAGATGLPAPLRYGAEAVRANPDGSFWLRLGSPDRRLIRVAPDGLGGWKAGERSAPALHDMATRGLLEDRGTLWILGRDHLFSFDLGWSAPIPAPWSPRIRRVLAEAGQVLWADGANNAATLALPAGRSALRFELAAARFSPDSYGRPFALYRTRVGGLDADWTPWSPEPWRDFSLLPPGRYQFRLQAGGQPDETGPEATLALLVPAPWWVTPWAWMVYLAGGALLVRTFVMVRTRALQLQASRLESVVATRTEELRRSNAELARLHRLELDETAMARLGEEKARLEMLRYQLNPHFLYNALNSIYGLVLTTPRAAADMVLRLAEFCRATLSRADEESSTVGACFERLALYLNIEKVRWKETLHVEIAVEEAVRDRRIPPFLLQPLVENAIKYGGSTSPEELFVRLGARVEPAAEPGGRTWLALEVANTGTWVDSAVARSRGNTGLGLANLRQRLERTHPGAHRITTEAKDGWVVVLVRLAMPEAGNRNEPAGSRRPDLANPPTDALA